MMRPRGERSGGFSCVLDFAPPCAGLFAARHDELPESLQVTFNLPLHEAECTADILDNAVRIVAETKGNAGGVWSDGVESNDAGVFGAAGAVPGDFLIRDLLNDLGIPFFGFSGDIGLPVEAFVIDLSYRLDALH